MGKCQEFCGIPENSSQTNLDVSLSNVRDCWLQNAEAYAKCSAQKYQVEQALKVCAGR